MLNHIHFLYVEHQRKIGLALEFILMVAVVYFAFVVYPQSVAPNITREDYEAFQAFIQQPGYKYFIGFIGGVVVALVTVLWFARACVDAAYEWGDSALHPEGEYRLTLTGKEKWLL